MIRFRLEGRDRFMRQIAQRANAYDALAAAAVREAAEDVRTAARVHLDNPALRPVSRTGTLARSIEIVETEGGRTAEIGTSVDYGTYLEFGTRRMPAYPWLGPAFAAVAPGLRARLRNALGRLGDKVK